jgi:hypothetical protein
MTSGRNIAEALQINNSSSFFYIYKDFVRNEEFILKGSEVWNFGISFHLKGYKRKVFLQFREVFDFDGRYNRVYNYLQGRGVHSIEETIKELELLPFHESFVNLFITDFLNDITYEKEIKIPEKQLNDFAELFKAKINSKNSEEEIKKSFTDSVSVINNFNSTLKSIQSQKSKPEEIDKFNNLLGFGKNNSSELQSYSYLFVFRLLDDLFDITINNSAFDEYLLWKPLIEIFGYLGYGDMTSPRYDLLKLASLSEKFEMLFDAKKTDSVSDKTKKSASKKKTEIKIDKKSVKHIVELLFEEKSFREFIHLHQYDSFEYFNKERFEEAIKWLPLFYILEKFENENKTLKSLSVKKALKERLTKFVLSYNLLRDASQKSDYRKDKFLEFFN